MLSSKITGYTNLLYTYQKPMGGQLLLVTLFSK
jgi:hypothetical protein